MLSNGYLGATTIGVLGRRWGYWIEIFSSWLYRSSLEINIRFAWFAEASDIRHHLRLTYQIGSCITMYKLFGTWYSLDFVMNTTRYHWLSIVGSGHWDHFNTQLHMQHYSLIGWHNLKIFLGKPAVCGAAKPLSPSLVKVNLCSYPIVFATFLAIFFKPALSPCDFQHCIAGQYLDNFLICCSGGCAFLSSFCRAAFCWGM